MRNFFFILIALTFTCITNAQVVDSVSIAIPVFSDINSKLTNVKGWLLQNNGEWVSANNKIPNDKTVVSSKSSEYKIGKDNFSSIELNPFQFKSKNYVVMIIRFTEGYYEFPNLKSNWKTNKAIVFYVFEKENLRYLIPDESMFDKAFSVNLDIYCSGYINLNNCKTGVKNVISETIIKTNQNISKNFTNLIFSLYPIKKENKEIMYFKIIKTYTKKALYEYYLQSSVQEQIFNKFYYETDYDYFINFITKCLSSSETFKKQNINLSDDKFSDVKEVKSNYEAIQNQFRSFNTTYEELKTDTSNFYAAPKISKYADTVAATSFIRSSKSVKTPKTKQISNVITKKTDTIFNKELISDTIFDILDSVKMKNLQESKANEVLNSDKSETPQTVISQSENSDSGLVLRVQIASASDNVSEDLYRKKFGISETIYIIPNGSLFKYAVGEFYSFREAIAYKQMITRDFNVAGAFIIAIENGKLISIAEARSKIKELK